MKDNMTTLEKAQSLINHSFLSELATGNKFTIRKKSVRKKETLPIKEEFEKHVEKFVIEKGL